MYFINNTSPHTHWTQISAQSIIIISLLNYTSEMSEFAFFRFKSANMLTDDEERHREEIISLTEQVLDSRGIECDARIAKISEDRLRDILEEVRRLRRKKKKNYLLSDDIKSNEDKYIENDEGQASYIR